MNDLFNPEFIYIEDSKTGELVGYKIYKSKYNDYKKGSNVPYYQDVRFWSGYENYSSRARSWQDFTSTKA